MADPKQGPLAPVIVDELRGWMRRLKVAEDENERLRQRIKDLEAQLAKVDYGLGIGPKPLDWDG